MLKRRRFLNLMFMASVVVVLLSFASMPIKAQTTLPTASQVVGQIRAGWNIGNTLEAICSETAWGNPAVTQQLINSVKAAGFNAVRIPAAWDCHANQSTMTIDSAWIARVKQVVDYALSANMYAIINIHWDGGWLEEHPLYAYQQAVNQKQRAYWIQIANSFKGYDQRLLFAGTNEVRADYNTPTTEHITVQQSYLQTFVDAVRSTGGNNASRTLVVQTYNTNPWHGLNYFTMPRDSISSRLAVEVHFYDPYDYTLNTSGSCLYWGAPYPSQSACTWGQEAYVDDLFNRIRAKWVANSIPVIIGEYGVGTRPNLNMPSREYYLRYIAQAATRNGLKTFYWDNGVPPSQMSGFALFNRSTGAIIDQGALNAIMQGVGGGSPTPTPSPTYYRLTARHSGKVADVQMPNTSDGAHIGQWGWTGANWQQWQFQPTDSGYYRIVSRHSGKCLDVYGGPGATGDGAQIVQWTCLNGTNQQWRMQDMGNGYVQLRARHSNKCLDVYNVSLADGAKLVQWTCGGGYNQQWQRQ